MSKHIIDSLEVVIRNLTLIEHRLIEKGLHREAAALRSNIHPLQYIQFYADERVNKESSHG